MKHAENNSKDDFMMDMTAVTLTQNLIVSARNAITHTHTHKHAHVFAHIHT